MIRIGFLSSGIWILNKWSIEPAGVRTDFRLDLLVELNVLKSILKHTSTLTYQNNSVAMFQTKGDSSIGLHGKFSKDIFVSATDTLQW